MKIGLSPAKIPLYMETDMDHRMDPQIPKIQIFPFTLWAS